MPDDVYDERIAALTDEMEAEARDVFSPEVLAATVQVLAGLAGPGGRALELGVGTGRVALPLAARGVEVHGIDLSPAMLGRLRAKPAGATVATTLGDMTSTRVEGTFDLVYAVWNTFINVQTQREQVACCRNAAAHLRAGGTFVVEVEVPPVLPPGETLKAFRLSDTGAGVDEVDVVTQRITSHHYWSQDGRFEHWGPTARYVWPSELDLMAELAGMTLRERWGGWDRAPFTAESTTFVAVYEKA